MKLWLSWLSQVMLFTSLQEKSAVIHKRNDIVNISVLIMSSYKCISEVMHAVVIGAVARLQRAIQVTSNVCFGYFTTLFWNAEISCSLWLCKTSGRLCSKMFSTYIKMFYLQMCWGLKNYEKLLGQEITIFMHVWKYFLFVFIVLFLCYSVYY